MNSCSRRWRRRLAGLLIGIPAVLVACQSASAEQSSGIDRLERMARKLKTHTAWKGQYHQVYLPAGMTQGEESSGTVWLAWPDKAMFQTDEEPGRITGLDGRVVRLIDLEVPSCDQQELSDEEWAQMPLAAAIDPQGALDHFAVLALDEQGVALIPKALSGVARVEVVMNAEDLPRQVTILDPQGATNTFSFDSWKARELGPPKGWLGQPPPGLNCVSVE